MPTCRRKRVVLTEPSDALLQAAQSDPNKHVFYLVQTGEIFDTYEFVSIHPFFPRSSPLFPQSICRPHVLLPSQAVPVRGHRKEWA